MKKLFDKYCGFIGVENEGNKRLLILFILVYLLLPFILKSKSNFSIYLVIDRVAAFGGIFENEFILILPYSILGIMEGVITFGIIIKTFNWVKDGAQFIVDGMNNIQKSGLFIGLFIGTFFLLYYFYLVELWRNHSKSIVGFSFILSLCSYIFSIVWVFLFKDKSKK